MSKNNNEIKLIESVLELYISAGKSGRGDDMRCVFSKDANISGYVGDDLFAGPIELLFSWTDENGPAEELVHEIGHIDVKGTIATARIESNHWHGHKFTDLFTLLKIDGEWKITSKVFHVHG